MKEVVYETYAFVNYTALVLTEWYEERLTNGTE